MELFLTFSRSVAVENELGVLRPLLEKIPGGLIWLLRCEEWPDGSRYTSAPGPPGDGRSRK